MVGTHWLQSCGFEPRCGTYTCMIYRYLFLIWVIFVSICKLKVYYKYFIQGLTHLLYYKLSPLVWGLMARVQCHTIAFDRGTS